MTDWPRIQPLENHMVIGDYYEEDEHTEPDPDEAYERSRDQIEADERQQL